MLKYTLMRPLSLAIIWHMHQPFYKDLMTGEYILPWVRLHAAKDYYDMVAILDKFPEVHVTFNLVPSLLTQIEDYMSGKVSDKFLDLTLKDPADLTPEERIFVLQNFFMANWEHMICPYHRYHDLLLKRGRFIPPSELPAVAKRFSPQELLDLQVWFNLAWFGFISKNEDPVVKELIKKGKNFSTDDKKAVIDKQFEILGKVIPKYREAEERGQVELTVSPFYHPILPLLCDTHSAKEATPQITLPELTFRHPEDAEAQIRMAVEYFTQKFGKRPLGMWPSEGSVSEAILPLVAQAAIKWIATDEGILERSLHKIEIRTHALTAAELYQPYLVERDGTEVAIVFRNHFISDQIGFVYYHFRIEDALRDFMMHMNNIHSSLPKDRNYLVSLILDGENAWEFYPGGGKEFLEAFYQKLSEEPLVKTVKVSQYLEENPPQKRLSRLFAGSWIAHNFRIWIGHPEDNLAWDYLNQARLALEGVSTDHPAWQAIYVAEGSDWCWWYGDDHSSANDLAFDELFRKHLKNVYLQIKRHPPAYLDRPIKKIRYLRPVREPVYLINPILDGEVTNYYEWLSAGCFDLVRGRGAMHQTETMLKEIYYGFNLENLYLRLDLNLNLKDLECGVPTNFSFTVNTFSPVQFKAESVYQPEKKRYLLNLFKLKDKQTWEPAGVLDSVVVGRIVELGLPFASIEAQAGQEVDFVIIVACDGKELERWPRDGVISFRVPTSSYEEEQWSV